MRKIINHAIQNDLIRVNAFKQIKLSDAAPEKENFPKYELHKLFDLNKLNEIETIHSLSFQFMVLTGCSYQDAQNLKRTNLSIENGCHRLSYNRNKTKHVSTQYLTPIAVTILDELYKYLESDKYLLPEISNQHFNRSLKLIGVKQAISRPLNTHLARAIFFQLTNELSDIKEITVDKLMGWSSNSKVKSKYGLVSESMLMKVSEKLNFFLNSMFVLNQRRTVNSTTKDLTSNLWSNKSMLN